ncbi:sensor histidine kinase [Magnetovibrio sp.]|uniref:sensor histidine kinase n=1 Tax=Magnetovibrio sp. TaxID=2024836 RepID=UPI002F94E030
MDARSRGKLLASVFGLLTVSFLGLVLFAFVLLKDQQDNLRQKTYDETGMAAVQIRLHYEALMGSLAQVEATHLGPAVDDVVLQFDILFERLTSLPSRPSYDILLDEETLAIQAKALNVLTSLLPNIDRAAEGDVEALRGLYAKLAPLRLSIERLAHKPVQIASERRAALTKSFENIAGWFYWVIGGLVMSGGGFAVIIWRQQTVAVRRQAELKELSGQLESALVAAEAGSRAKSDFMGHMSHELRTPMNAVLGFAQLLEISKLDESQAKSVKHILRSGNLLVHLIDQVLELNKIETGHVTINRATVPVAPLIDECMALMGVMAQERHVALNVQPPDVPVNEVVTDASRLQQILVNLMSNAIKYNREGGQVTVSWGAIPGERVRFSVADTGEGIEPGQEDKIFLPFNRLGRETQNIEGTGIGLTITMKLVKILGGDIGYKSTPGEGTTFWFDLPLT